MRLALLLLVAALMLTIPASAMAASFNEYFDLIDDADNTGFSGVEAIGSRLRGTTSGTTATVYQTMNYRVRGNGTMSVSGGAYGLCLSSDGIILKKKFLKLSKKFTVKPTSLGKTVATPKMKMKCAKGQRATIGKASTTIAFKFKDEAYKPAKYYGVAAHYV